MAVITNYVCDVSGVSSNDKEDFIQVEIYPKEFAKYQHNSTGYKEISQPNITKLISKKVAQNLGLWAPKVPDPEDSIRPEVSFEGKLKVLLRDYIKEVAQEVVDENQ